MVVHDGKSYHVHDGEGGVEQHELRRGQWQELTLLQREEYRPHQGHLSGTGTQNKRGSNPSTREPITP